MTDFVQPDTPSASLWAQFELRLGGKLVARLLFAVACLALLWVDFSLKESATMPAVLYSSVGLLMVALWLSDWRTWPIYLAIHMGAVLIASAVLAESFLPLFVIVRELAEWCAAITGTLVARWLIRDSFAIQIRQSVRLLVAAMLGTLAGALVAAVAQAWCLPDGSSFAEHVWLWWAGHCLGVITLGPVVMAWVVRLRDRHPELTLKSRIDLLVIGSWIVVVTWLVFRLAETRHGSLLPLLLLISPMLVYASFRVPPRWAVSLSAMAVFLTAWFAAQRTAPFVVPDPLVRIGLVQAMLGIFATVTHMLSIVIAEVRITLAQLRESETRYRSFIKLSPDAVWRIEVEPPMPVALTHAEQIQWLHEHARIAERSEAYGRIDASDDFGDAHARWHNLPWREAFEQQLAEAAQKDFFIYDMKFEAVRDGRQRTYLISFSAMVEDGLLRRFWGIARDVTELAELNARMLREQQRLKSYARQIVTAEEKARRATAVDLHDGIGQSLVSMAMMLEVARQQIAPDVRLLVDEIRVRLRAVQEHTGRMISDLSPPGLYDLGLGPALQWLSVYSRTRDGLHVALDCDVREGSINLDTRVLVFKLVRELLRNVVKHAGVRAAKVDVHGDTQQLRVEVSDHGRGFEWQMDMFGARSGGFGLWSIADRIHEVGGRFQVDSVVGQGSRFTMAFPLHGAASTADSGTFSVRDIERSHVRQ